MTDERDFNSKEAEEYYHIPIQEKPKNWAELVKEFHLARGGQAHDIPVGRVRRDITLLRIQLIATEFGELTEAIHTENRLGILDALCDLTYVVFGTMIAYGMLPVFDAAFREIHKSNMSKSHFAVTAGMKYGPHGKGKDYRPPNLEAILANYLGGRCSLK